MQDRISVSYTHLDVYKRQTEVEAINLLLKDSVRLAITTRTLTEEERNSFHSRKFYPREMKLPTDGLALIVNRANPDSLISVCNCLLYTSRCV